MRAHTSSFPPNRWSRHLDLAHGETTMRTVLTMGCILIVGLVAACAARALPQTNPDTQPTRSTAQALLREASEIALKQGETERFWTEHVLLEIGEVQIRAGDFEGALRSICGSDYDYGRE